MIFLHASARRARSLLSGRAPRDADLPAADGLEASAVTFAYRGRTVLSGATLRLSPGELVCLLGTNGAGKSTLLKIMLGLLQPAAGVVMLQGRPLHGWKRQHIARRVAYVPQGHLAPFPYSVQQVAMMGRLPAHGFMASPGSADQACVVQILERLGIYHLSRRAYTELSGGERQLTLIARALAQSATLLIMDEPLTGLDYGNQVRVLRQLQSLVADGYGVLMTTHDPNQALTSCQRVALLTKGQIAAQGKPEHVLTPQAIHALYGVRVALLRSAGGQGVAFKAIDHSEDDHGVLK